MDNKAEKINHDQIFKTAGSDADKYLDSGVSR